MSINAVLHHIISNLAVGKVIYLGTGKQKLMQMKKIVLGLIGIAMLSTGVYAQTDSSTTKTTVTTTTTTSAAVPVAETKDDNRSYAQDWPVFYLGVRFMPTFTNLGYSKVDN